MDGTRCVWTVASQLNILNNLPILHEAMAHAHAYLSVYLLQLSGFS